MTHSLIETLLDLYNDNKFDNESALSSLSEGDTHDDLSELFTSIADNSECELREGGYSGRGMYGRQCWAITGRNIAKIIEVAAQHGVTGAQWDSMGYDYVVYWPDITYMGPEEGED